MTSVELLALPALPSVQRTGHTDSATERCWATSTGSWSLTVVPSTIVPARLSSPVASSSASANVVLPAPECPTSATLRIFSGRSAVSNVAAPVRGPAFLFDIRWPPDDHLG